jgi:uncharacterized membrane protein
MKKTLLTGFIALLPLALTLIIINWLFNFLTTPLAGLMESVIITYENYLNLSPEKHAALVLFLSRVLALILLFVLILLLGICGRKFLGKFLLKIPEKLFSRIPLVGTIFRLTRDITKAVFSEDTKTFQKTILLPFPNPDTQAIGFITGEIPPALKEKLPGLDLVVFVPTAPHPISGFILFAPKHLATPVDIEVEEAFKFLISCGSLSPKP